MKLVTNKNKDKLCQLLNRQSQTNYISLLALSKPNKNLIAMVAVSGGCSHCLEDDAIALTKPLEDKAVQNLEQTRNLSYYFIQAVSELFNYRSKTTVNLSYAKISLEKYLADSFVLGNENYGEKLPLFETLPFVEFGELNCALSRRETSNLSRVKHKPPEDIRFSNTGRHYSGPVRGYYFGRENKER